MSADALLTPTVEVPTETAKKSPVEGIKESSRWLRGTLVEEMKSGVDHFNDDNKNLLKFHGSYQQEDRDARKNRSKTGVGKHYMFMIRLKLPGGKMTPAQYLAMDDIAGKYANGTIRFTTRQSIQFHGIIMKDLKSTMQGINDSLVSTLGACGDVNRNVMSCPAPFKDPARLQMQKLADEIAVHLAPRSNAYHDVWLNGEKWSPDAEQAEGVEPIYGKVYLPRKFKIGFSLPTDNCIDIHAQDLGFLAIIENGQVIGYNVMVGGGMGRTHGNASTFAHLSKYICFVKPEDVVATAEAIITFYRDHGNRADRKRARIKYVIHDWGVDKVREVLNRDYFQKPLVLPKPVEITEVDLHHGWQAQGDGKWFLGLSVENGRVKDEEGIRFRSGLRAIVEKFRPSVRVSAQQDVLLCDLDIAHRPEIDRLLTEYGIPRPETLSMVQKWSMACPAIPTCGLAISESERTLPSLVHALETELKEMGLAEERISVRMTGCPNGCARPYQSDIGLVGRSGQKYTVYLGGSSLGTRLNFPFQDLVLHDQIVPLVKKVLTHFKAERVNGETFGDYCARHGVEKLCAKVGLEVPKDKHAKEASEG